MNKGTLYNGLCKVKGNPQGTYGTRCECEVGKNEKPPLCLGITVEAGVLTKDKNYGKEICHCSCGCKEMQPV